MVMSNIAVRKYGNYLCRLCLEKDEELMDIFRREGNGLLITQIMSELLNVKVTADDNYPKVICKLCYSTLMAFFRTKSKHPVENLPNFVLFKNQCQIVKSTFDYTKRYNVETPDYQHSPVSWEHSPLSLELEEMAAEEDLRARRTVVDNLLISVAEILKNIRVKVKLEEDGLPDDGGRGEEGGRLVSHPIPTRVQEGNPGEVPAGCGSECGLAVKDEGEGMVMPDGRQVLEEGKDGRRRSTRVTRWRVPEGTCGGDNSQEEDSSESYSGNSSESCSEDSSQSESLSGPLIRLRDVRVCRNQMPTPSRRSESNVYHCADCDRTFDRTLDLSRHISMFHGMGFKDAGKVDEGDDETSVRSGKKTHVNEEAMLVRMSREVEGEDGWIRCRACGMRFTSLIDLKGHILMPRLQTRLQERGKQHNSCFTCCCCSRRFKWLCQLERHALTQHGTDRPHVCRECGLSFKLEKYLKKHVRLHSQGKRVECGDCGKLFRERSQLRLHSAVHTKERAFECGDCGKRFRAKHLLKIHLRTHDKSQHLKCPHCPSKFAQMSDLRKHSARHSGVRDFACPTCNKAFLYKRNLNSHLRLHSSLKVALYDKPA